MQSLLRRYREFFKNTPRDRVILSLLGLGTYLLAMRFDVYERIDAWLDRTPELDVFQLDELFVVAMVVSIGLIIVSWRRYNELYISNTRFRVIFDQAPIGMSIHDLQGRYVYANPALCRCLGYTEVELKATDFRSLTYADDIAPSDALSEKLLKGECQTVQLEKRYIHKHGHLVWASTSVSLVRKINGAPHYLLAQLEDITERKLAEEKLKASQAQLAEAQSIAHIGSWETDLIRHKLDWSDEQYRIFGLDPAKNKATYLTYIDRIHPADRERAAHNIARAVQTGQSYALEYRVVWPSGDIRYVHAKGKVVHDQAGKPVRLIGTVQDITETKQIEETVRRLAVIVETSQDAIISVDAQGIIKTWNKGAERLYGYQAHEAIGQSWELLTFPGPHVRSTTIFNQLLQGVKVEQIEGVIPHRDGRTIPISITTATLRDEYGTVTGMAAIMRDISQRKLAEAEMLAALKAQRAANEELRELSRAKSDFVATVSHEFRSALAGIRAYSELMLLIDLPAEEVKSYAQRITDDAESLANLITDLLDLDRVESGQMKLHIKPLDLNHLIQDMAEMARQKSNKHTFPTQLDTALPLIPGDIDKLSIALSNLLDNAIKYSPDGGPILLTSRAEDHVAHITIQDPGVGIPGKDLERIFERFARAEREATRYIWGTGLGLPITQQIVHLHGGRIWAESVEGAGSTFHLTLPLTPVTTELPLNISRALA